MLLIGQLTHLIVHFLDLGLALKDLITSIRSLHEFIIILALPVVPAEACLCPCDQLLVHLLLKQDSDLLFTQDVNIAQQHHILALDALVRLLVELFALLESITEVINVALHRPAAFVLLLMKVGLTNFVLVGLLKDVDTMEAFDALFQFFVVIDVIVKHLVDLVLELLLVLLLLLDHLDSPLLLTLHTLTLQSHIAHN